MAIDKHVKDFITGHLEKKVKDPKTKKMKTIKINLSEDIKMAVDELASDSAYIYDFDCPPIDIPLGGGIPSGRIIEIFGEESHGKTTFALCITKIFAKYWRDRNDEKFAILWIESESALDKARAAYMDVPIDKFIIYETDLLEDVHEKIKNYLLRCVEKKMKLMIVHDTIAAVSTRAEKESGTNAGGLMEKPRLIKFMLRDIVMELGMTDSSLIILNQVGIKLGQFQATWDSGGGKGLKHFASIRSKVIKTGEEHDILPSGEKKLKQIIMDIVHVKNKMTTPKLKSMAVLNVEEGIDILDTCIRYMKINKLIPMTAGGWSKMSIPAGYAEDGKPRQMIEIKWQTIDQLRNLFETKYPHAQDWINYQIYACWTAASPLIKAKNIHKVWGYEEKFFGKRHMKLTEKERRVALLQHKSLKIEAEDHDKDADDEIKVTKEDGKIKVESKATKAALTEGKAKTNVKKPTNTKKPVVPPPPSKKLTATQKRAAAKKASEVSASQ